MKTWLYLLQIKRKKVKIKLRNDGWHSSRVSGFFTTRLISPLLFLPLCNLLIAAKWPFKNSVNSWHPVISSCVFLAHAQLNPDSCSTLHRSSPSLPLSVWYHQSYEKMSLLRLFQGTERHQIPLCACSHTLLKGSTQMHPPKTSTVATALPCFFLLYVSIMFVYVHIFLFVYVWVCDAYLLYGGQNWHQLPSLMALLLIRWDKFLPLNSELTERII